MQDQKNLVAVVDDEESVRRALGRLIRAAGYVVETFSSGSDFLQSLPRRKPRCLVLDLRMPAVSGFDILQVLQGLPGGGVPAVVITGDDSADSRERALRHGVRAYLRKPVDDAALLNAIQAAMLSKV